MNHYNHNKNSDFDNDNIEQENSSIKLVEKSDSIKNNTDNIDTMFHDMSQFNENPSQEQKKGLQG